MCVLYLVLVEEEAGGLSRRVHHEREPVAEPLQHYRILKTQIVRRKPHPLTIWQRVKDRIPRYIGIDNEGPGVMQAQGQRCVN